jgi:hypothetical protein
MKALTSNKLCCNICNKQYTNKTSLDKHKILCDYTIKSKRERKIDLEEVEDIPSHYQLAKIVQELTLNKIKMEEKMKKMEEKIANLTNSKKRKLNIVLWLNTNIVPTIGFLEWVNTSLTVKPTHFEILMENTIFYTIHKIFEENLLENTDFIYPITCFLQKNGIFYICEKQSDGSPEWRKLIVDDMILILNTIQKNLIKELTKWKLKNQNKFDDDSKLSILFNKSVIKLMNVPFSQDHNLSRIKNSLYNYLKKDLKSVVEFDLEF